jgi:hypothetical protein
MVLHRDIYWVGRQWAVTGYGVQACDQKQKGEFDIEASRLWEGGLLESIRALDWLNIADFDKALSVARKRFPEPPRKAAPPLPEAIVLPVSDGNPVAPLPQAPKLEVPKVQKLDPVEPPKPGPLIFRMLILGCRAKFVSPWRIRIRR